MLWCDLRPFLSVLRQERKGALVALAIKISIKHVGKDRLCRGHRGKECHAGL